MGQKVNPHGLRVGIIKDWSSKWYSGKRDFSNLLIEDKKIRKYVKNKFYTSGVSKVEIERAANRVKVTVFTAKPGMVIGKGGAGVDDLKKELEVMTGKNVFINIIEIKVPELDAQLVAENIASQLEKGFLQKGHETGHPANNACGSQGYQNNGVRKAGRSRNSQERKIQRRHHTAADAEGRHRVWFCRGGYHLRKNRGEGMDIQRGNPG